MLYLREDEDSFLLAATRYGHAAGMSQIGALQMAKEGLSYTDILRFYYAVGSKSQLVAIDEKVDKVKPPDSKPPAKTTATKKGKVSVSNGGSLNVRSGPGTDRKILGTLKHGATVTIKGNSGSWYKITYKGKTAYVKKSYIKVNSSSDKPAKKAKAKKKGTVKLKSGKLNVRSGPGTDRKILGTLKKGATVTIKGSKGSWYKITFKGKTGYVKKSYIKLK
jgi:uncharacterized protein YgiM (DUF1202 family)